MAERQTVALDVVGSTPTTHPNSTALSSFENVAFDLFVARAQVKQSVASSEIANFSPGVEVASLVRYI